MERERCESLYEVDIGGTYRDIQEGTIYPPHLGYSEFTTSTSSLGFETETFSELFFSSSDDEDSDGEIMVGPETSGILYKISHQLDKVPRFLSAKSRLEEKEDILDDFNIAQIELDYDPADSLVRIQDQISSLRDWVVKEENIIRDPAEQVRNEIYKEEDEEDQDKILMDENDPLSCLVKIQKEICCLRDRVEKEDGNLKGDFEDEEERLHLVEEEDEEETIDNYDPVRALSRIQNQISALIKCVEKDEKEMTERLRERRSGGEVMITMSRRLGSSTVDIRSVGRQDLYRSLPVLPHISPASSVEYISPTPGVGFVNSGYCIWASEELLAQGGIDESPSKGEPLRPEEEPQKKHDVPKPEVLQPVSIPALSKNGDKLEEPTKISQPSDIKIDSKESSVSLERQNSKSDQSDEISIIDAKGIVIENIQSGEDVERIIKEMESRLLTERDRKVGGSSSVSIVTDLAEDSPIEEEEEVPYYVSQPTERRSPRNVKFRFDSGDYRDDEESDKEIEEKSTRSKVGKIEKKFERMASETKASELDKSDGEFQKMISQMSVEEMDEALQLWDKEGLTPSDLDSKSLTEPSDETSPQEGTLATEEEDQPQEHPPPIPSPRAQQPLPPKPDPLSPESLPSQKPLADYAQKKSFWEQVSQQSSDSELSKESAVEKPPVPKPRLSISGSLDKAIYSESSQKEDASKIESKNILPEDSTSVDAVDSSISKEESIDDSEVEYIQSHRDELSYDNDAFDCDENVDQFGSLAPHHRKPFYKRSVSLPSDTSLDPSTNSVRTKKRIFEAQIKKEMVVEQLMSQLEEEASPEHKSLKHKNKKPINDTQTIVTRQIHTEIFSDELDQQIDSLVPENKELRQPLTNLKDQEKLEALFLETSSPDTSISNSAAEVLQYKGETMSKPSDSLEVHIDKSELEETEKEKELDDDLKEMEETRLQTPFSKDKVGSVTSSQGESEDTLSESDVTPEDSRFKEQQEIQEWPIQESKSDKDKEKKQRSIYTPEEHLPDTVWEVPVQEYVEPLPEETVEKIPLDQLVKGQTETVRKLLTESEAIEIAKELVDNIEEEICKRESILFEKTIKKDEPSIDCKQLNEALNVKLRRTDTNTSSMEITDEDLRSSGVDSDISPLESQACFDEKSEEDSCNDIDNIELGNKESYGEDVLEKTLAEVKESLEAVKEELIEEKKKKKDSITKESPSEFEFKVLSLDHKIKESIKESNLEEKTIVKEGDQPFDFKYKSTMSEKDERELSTSSEMKAEVSLKSEEPDIDIVKSKEERVELETISFSKEIKIGEKKEEKVGSTTVLEDSQGATSLIEEQSSSETQKLEEVNIVGKESTSVQIDSTFESEKISKSSESFNYDSLQEISNDNITLKKTEVKQDSKIMVEECKKKVDSHASEFITENGALEQKFIETSEILSMKKVENKQQHIESYEIKELSQLKLITKELHTDDEDEKPVSKELALEEEVKEEYSGEYSKSPGPEDTQEDTSSSSEARMGTDTPPMSGDKPTIVIRKHSKTVRKIQGELSDPYSSSGESQFHSFEQTSESLRTPGSRPLSSDVEGLVANLAGVTGSSEYESAVSGQSTTATSREFQTAVSSLSSRDSMKSLDSESSGNLASIEVSSEASETLVPSAMELDEVEIKTPLPEHKVEETPWKGGHQSFSESNGQSVSFDISTEEISEDELDAHSAEVTQKMKRSHEMTFQPEPRPIVDERLSSSVEAVSVISDSTAMRTVIELSRTESDKMDGSATSDQLTVSGTSEQLSLSESKDTESAMDTKKDTVSTQLSQDLGEIHSVTITTTSVVEQGVPSVCTQVTSKTASQSNGPTQVEYNVEYDEVETEVKKRPGHRRNGSTSFRPSMIPVFQKKELEKKADDIVEDSAESDKYSQTLTSKEGSQEEKKDIDEAEKLEEEFYQTEADQGIYRDIREGRFMKEVYEYEETKDYETKSDKSRLSSVAFSEDRPDSELAELLKQCSSDGIFEDPIERPQTPEPVEECEIKDDTPEFSSEAQASVTELEMEYSGAFSRSNEYEAHVSPIREKGLHWEHDPDMAEAEAAFHSFSSLPATLTEEPVGEKHELETKELVLKEERIDRTSPVPGITVTQHMTPLLDESFVFPDIDENLGAPQQLSESVSSKASSETSIGGKEYILESATTKSLISDDFQDDTSHTEESTVFEKEASKEVESASDSPTSDSFELLEKPDLADEFVIIEEVGKEAEEQDREGKSVKIDGRRMVHRPSEKEVVSPPSTSTKMTKIKYYTKGGAEDDGPFEFESGTPPKQDSKTEESSQEGSPPSAAEDFFKPEVEAGKKWMEMQFQGTEPVAQIFGYDIEYDRAPLEDIKEEELADLESSSKIGSMGSQVSYSIGSFGSVKESLSSTPDYDLLAGRKFLTRSGEHDDVSMSSLQEFERLENLIALESTKHRSSGSQDSLTSSSNSRKHGSKSGGDDISLASLKEFEGLESACIAAERIEKKAKLEEESLLSEIEEGHESQASESESCVTVSVSGLNRESDEDDYEKRMFEIDEIIRQAQTNVEQFMDAKSKDGVDKVLISDQLALGRADSLEEISKVPDLDLDQPSSISKPYCGKSYITQWEDLGEELLTSTDSLELRTQISKASAADPFTTSTDSLEVKLSHDVMSVSTDSIEASQKKKTQMTDSIEVGEKSCMITSCDSLEEKITDGNSLEDDQVAEGEVKEADEGWDGSLNRMPPPRAEFALGSSDSLEPTSSTATHATYHCETDSVMSSSITSADSTTMVDDDGAEARAEIWFDEGKPYVTEVIEPGDEEFSQIIHRTVEMPPQITKVSFKGDEAEQALREYIEKFDPGEDMSETREVDAAGNVHIKRVVQKRVVLKSEEMSGSTTRLEGENLEQYLKSLSTQLSSGPCTDPSTLSQSSPLSTTSQSKGQTKKNGKDSTEIKESQLRGGRPMLKYDISLDEDPEFDPREHDWRFNLHTHLEREEEQAPVELGKTSKSNVSPSSDQKKM